MTLVSIASSLAIVLGFSGTIPHIRTMVRTRSSNGQSAIGWSIGITVNMLTGYVNLFGLGAVTMGVGNALSCTFSTIALLCVLRFRHGAAPAAAAANGRAAAALAVRELPTREFHAIKRLVDEECVRRQERRAPRASAHAHDEPHELPVELQPALAA